MILAPGEAAASCSKKPPAPPRQTPRPLEAVAGEVLKPHSEFRGPAPRNRPTRRLGALATKSPPPASADAANALKPRREAI